MGLGRIPWYESVRWAEYERLDEEETETLVDVIERLDLEEHKLENPPGKAKDAKDGRRSSPSS